MVGRRRLTPPDPGFSLLTPRLLSALETKTSLLSNFAFKFCFQWGSQHAPLQHGYLQAWVERPSWLASYRTSSLRNAATIRPVVSLLLGKAPDVCVAAEMFVCMHRARLADEYYTSAIEGESKRLGEEQQREAEEQRSEAAASNGATAATAAVTAVAARKMAIAAAAVGAYGASGAGGGGGGGAGRAAGAPGGSNRPSLDSSRNLNAVDERRRQEDAAIVERRRQEDATAGERRSLRSDGGGAGSGNGGDGGGGGSNSGGPSKVGLCSLTPPDPWCAHLGTPHLLSQADWTFSA